MKSLIVIGGGKGTRMADYFPGVPKLLMPLHDGETVLTKLISEVHPDRAYFALGQDHTKVQRALETLDVPFSISIESEPLGTYGALKQTVIDYFDDMPDKLFVCLGDLVCVGFDKYQRAELSRLAQDDRNYFFYSKNNHPQDSDRLTLDRNGQIVQLHKKKHSDALYFENRTISGCYFLNKYDIIACDLVKGDLITDFLPDLMTKKKVYASQLLFDLSDIGTPERYKNLIVKSAYKNPRKYILMDLDGTLIVDRGSHPNAYKLAPQLINEAVEIIRLAKSHMCKVILVSNQGDLAKGFLDIGEFEDEIRYIEEILCRAGVRFDDLFFCPHYPESGFAGEVPTLKKICDCRKPKTGMWKQIQQKWQACEDNTLFIGNAEADQQFAEAIGLPYIDISAFISGSDGPPQLDMFIKS